MDADGSPHLSAPYKTPVATVTIETAVASLSLAENVYEDTFEFHETTRMILAGLDVDSSDAELESCVNLVIEAVGRDPAKLLAVFDIVHEKVIDKWSWATGPAINFYKLFFSRVDMTIVEYDEFGPNTESGIDAAVNHIINKCAEEIYANDDWASVQVRSMTGFVLEALKQGGNLISTSAVASLLEWMVESWNILVNSDNMNVFANFLRSAIPELQQVNSEGGLQAVFTGIRDLPRQAELCDDDSASGQRSEIDIPQSNQRLKLFEEEVDWNCAEVDRLINKISAKMKIGAPLEVRKETGAVIEVMVNSDMIFFLDSNLHVLWSILVRVALCIDAANQGWSLRLTAALITLGNPGRAQSMEQVRIIRGIRQALGR
ncbi:hypothetical protein EK21DRAFT_113119 [Setomelanomma holmii]|uniref:Uncharacterized protein n=1 Tax=Setomelanomma holmii TaxID=210430 RepID=A0A9P4H8Y5_9PLEO|nr:hypothetical protein EK21DRAFT_113119 [Setomelanomma holmii]